MFMESATGPVYIPDGVPQFVIDGILANAGGPALTAPPAAAPGPDSGGATPAPPPAISPPAPGPQPPPAGAIPAPGTPPATSGGRPGPDWYFGPGGWTYVPPGSPGWVYRKAQGLPLLPGDPGFALPTPQPGGTTPGAAVGTVLRGILETPPDGIPLVVDWARVAATFANANAAANPPGDVGTMLGRLDALTAEMGFPGGSPWDKVLKLLKYITLTGDPGAPGGPTIGVAALHPGIDAQQGIGALLVLALLAMGTGLIEDVEGLIQRVDPVDKLRPFAHRLEQLGVDAQQGLTNLLTSTDVMDLETAQGRAVDALGIAMGAGVTAHALGVGIEALYPTKELGLGQAAGLVAEFAGFGPIVAAMWGSLIHATIRRPLEQLHNREFPTALPDVRSIVELAQQHEYDGDPISARSGTPAGFEDALLRHGSAPDHIARTYMHLWKPPRLYDVIRLGDSLLNTGPPPESVTGVLAHFGVDPGDPYWWLDLQLRISGLAPWSIPLYKQGLIARAAAPDNAAMRAAWHTAAKKGYITGDELSANMVDAGFAFHTVVAARRQLDFERLVELTDPLITEWTDAFVREQMTVEDLRVQLAAVLHDPMVVDARVHIAQLKHDIRSRQTVTAEQDRANATIQRELVTAYRAQLVAGTLAPESFLAAAETAGLSPALAQAALYTTQSTTVSRANERAAAAVAREHDRARSVLASAYAVQYEDGKLTEEGLRGALIAAGTDAQLTAALVARAWAQKVKRADDAAAAAEKVLKAKDAATHTAQERAHAAATRAQATQLLTAFTAHQDALLRAGEIDEQQMTTALNLAGMPIARAAEIAATSALRASGATSRKATPPAPAPAGAVA